MNVPTKLLTPSAKPPTRAKPGDAAYDLYANENAIIYRGARVVIKTGVSMAIPDGYYGQILGRSGLAAKSGIAVLGGVIDSSYRGDVSVILLNTDMESTIQIKPGERIAQLVILKCEDATFSVVDQLPTTERGDKGFGSTG